MISLTVIVASSGRPTLTRALASVASQMLPGDQLLLDVNNDSPAGHRARNRMMPLATGYALMFCDDDDEVVEGALTIIRTALETRPRRPHFFRMRYADGRTIWQVPKLMEGQVSTGTIVVPNVPEKLGAWGDRYAGDFDFAASTAAFYDLPPVWREEVISNYRPAP